MVNQTANTRKTSKKVSILLGVVRCRSQEVSRVELRKAPFVDQSCTAIMHELAMYNVAASDQISRAAPCRKEC